jgi:hypothetical protein
MASNPPFYDPEITVYGMALEDHGLAVANAIDGLGLLTFGLLWTCGNIWALNSTPSSTTWSDCGSTSSTTWTEVTRSEC